MNNFRLSLMIVVTFSLLSSGLFAQARGRSLPLCPGGNLVNGEVLPVTTFDVTNRSFEYQYSVSNKIDSSQSVWLYSIEFHQKEAVPSFLGTPQKLSWRFVFVFHPRQADPSAPSFVPDNVVNWGSTSASDFIPPGNSLSGFLIKDAGLPGAVRAWVQGYAPLPAPVSDVGDATCSPPDPYSPNNNVIVNTVGPDILPTNLANDQLLDRLISLKEQAFQLGWIDNQGVANSLDAKLTEVKIKLQAGQTKVAGNILKSFILDLIAQHVGQTGQGQGQGNPQGKHVNDNAFYLLKPNAEFILHKLGQL